MAAKKAPPEWWTNPEENVDTVFKPSAATRPAGAGTDHGISVPTQVYPLYENARRAHRAQTISENHKESSQLYALFAGTASQNPVAWNYGKPAQTQETIGNIDKKNRLISFPCIQLHKSNSGSLADLI